MPAMLHDGIASPGVSYVSRTKLTPFAALV
jgi:hypothetical protein